MLTAHIRTIIAESPFHGEGHRKIWARLRAQGLRPSKRRTLVVMRAADLLGPTRLPTPVVARPHDGTIVTTSPNVMWGTDATDTVTLADGQVTIFGAIDHCTAEGVGRHAAKYGTRFEALEPVRQGVRDHFGGMATGAATGLTMRHDHGSQYMSDDVSSRAPVPRHRVVAGLRPPAGRQRVHRTVLPHPQGTAAVGAALHGCRGPAAGPAHLQGDLEPAVVDRAARLPRTCRRPSRVGAHTGRVNTLTRLSKKSVAVHERATQTSRLVDLPLIIHCSQWNPLSKAVCAGDWRFSRGMVPVLFLIAGGTEPTGLNRRNPEVSRPISTLLCCCSEPGHDRGFVRISPSDSFC